jgi:hypothetical protein
MAPETMVSILAVTLLATGWILWLLPVGRCTECVHCQVQKLAVERKREAQASRLYGIPLCPACGRHHGREEEHRH